MPENMYAAPHMWNLMQKDFDVALFGSSRPFQSTDGGFLYTFFYVPMSWRISAGLYV